MLWKLDNSQEKDEKSFKKIEKKLFRKFCFSIITFCTYLVAVKVDLFLAIFCPLLLGMLNGVDKILGFLHTKDDEEHPFYYSFVKGKVSHTLRSGN